MKKALKAINLRRAAQLLCLGGFLWLFLQTEYRGLDQLPYPVSLLFRLDPLAALADLLAPGPFSWRILWPALALVVLTALFGRFFCGWICPLGTTLDGCGKLVGRTRNCLGRSWRRGKYLLLFALSAAALFGVQLLGLFDPLAIFLRTLTLSFYPAYNLVMNGVFDFAYDHRLPVISPALNALYPFWRDHLMAFYPPSYTLGLFTLLIFLLILLLEKIERRFWCKNLCPLGALLGLCSRRALLRRTPEGVCEDCSVCAEACRMTAEDDRGRHPGECIECLDCSGYCPHQRVAFQFSAAPAQKARIDLRRRNVMLSLAAGALIAPTVRMAPESSLLNPFLIRPPGAAPEDEFLRRCVRCGECMKVCIGQALHPALLEAGATGIWTPLLVARLGYCEYNCTLCGQVCPTGALQRLSPEEKRNNVIGLAVFDKDRCLPFARAEECLVCEEHCPTPQKAIVFEEKKVLVDNEVKTIKIPRVIRERCIGCGICETRCPLHGQSAIRVTNEVESRRPESLQSSMDGPYG